MADAPQNPFEVELLTTQYTTALELLLQQKTSKLRSFVTTGSHVGKMASPIQQRGTLEFRAPTGRYSPIQAQVSSYTRRWVFPTDRDCGEFVDTFDELKTIVDPKSGINEAIMAAAGRFFDDLIITSALASASVGVDASSLSTETFNAGAIVSDSFGASASTGMSYPKLVEAFRLMRLHQVDLDSERPKIIIGSTQESDLKKQQEVISREYNDRVVVEEGRVTSLAGFDLVMSERLATSSSDTLRNCIAFVPSGLYLGIWKDMTTNITVATQLSSQPWQIYCMISAGATRTQQWKVIQVNCADTAGADPTAP